MPVLVSAYFRARRADGTHPRSAAACAISPDPRRFAGHRRGRDGRRARPHRPSCRKTPQRFVVATSCLLAVRPRGSIAPTAARRSATRRESRESLFREWTTNGNASPAPPSRATTDTTTFRGPGSCASTVRSRSSAIRPARRRGRAGTWVLRFVRFEYNYGAGTSVLAVRVRPTAHADLRRR